MTRFSVTGLGRFLNAQPQASKAILKRALDHLADQRGISLSMAMCLISSKPLSSNWTIWIFPVCVTIDGPKTCRKSAVCLQTRAPSREVTAGRLHGERCGDPHHHDDVPKHLTSLRDYRWACRVIPRTNVRGYRMPSLRDWVIPWPSATGRSHGPRATGRSANREAMSGDSLGRESQVRCASRHAPSREATAGRIHGERCRDPHHHDDVPKHLTSLRDYRWACRVIPRTNVRGYRMPSLRDWVIPWPSATGRSHGPRATGRSANREAMSGDSLGRESQVRCASRHAPSREATAGRIHGERCRDPHHHDDVPKHLTSLRDYRWACRVIPRTNVRGYRMPSLRDWVIPWRSATGRSHGPRRLAARMSLRDWPIANREAMSGDACPRHVQSREATAG